MVRDSEIKEKVLETDVLVIGAGGAGLRAAIEARNTGARVLIVSKGDFPSGCTPIAMGAMLAPFDKEDSPECHFEDTVRAGDYLNDPKLVRLLAEQARQRTQDLESYGTEFDKEDEHYKPFPLTGSSVPRGILAHERYHGGYIKGLVKEVKRLGIAILEQIMISDLLKGKHTVAGAIGLELKTNTILTINAKAVILATGGAGNLYRLTTNPTDITGDGYALAYRAGACLQDMEFVQGRVCLIYPEAMRGMPPPADGLVTLGGRFYNGLCERYMRKYFPDKLELVTRAQMAICAQKEIQAGRQSPHGGVFGDLSGVKREELDNFKRFMKACRVENLDPIWQPYEWSPGAHHFMGGVVINAEGETIVPGLYAAGEVAAGIHGANRLAGNALTETQVFGAVAGKYAAKRAFSNHGTPLTPDQIGPLRNRLRGILKRDKGFEPLEVKEEITEIMSRYVMVIRNETGLQKASRVLNKIKKNKIGNLCLGRERSFQKLTRLLEVENLLLVGELVTLAAMERKETRGAHNREDYPELDERWAKNIVLQRENEQTRVGTKPVG